MFFGRNKTKRTRKTCKHATHRTHHAPSSNTRGHHQRRGLILEVGNGEVSVRLILTAVQRQSVIAGSRQILEKGVTLLLRVDENQDVSFFIPNAQQLIERGANGETDEKKD